MCRRSRMRTDGKRGPCPGPQRTRQRQLTGVGSTLRARSRARTVRTCTPRVRLMYVMRAGHAENARPSRLHWKVTSPSFAENENVAVLLPVTAGGRSPRNVSGGRVSTRQCRCAGVESALPAASRARTRSVCVPPSRPVRTRLDEQLVKAPPSREQPKPTSDSVATRAKEAVGPVTPPPRIDVSGGVRSTTQRKTTGVLSAFPARSRALTAKRCVASVRFANDCGERHLCHGESSSLQAKRAPGSFAAKRKRADFARVADGSSFVKRVAGARVSTVHS